MALNSCVVTAQLICTIGFAYANFRFSRDAAQMRNLNIVIVFFCFVFIQNIDGWYLLEPPSFWGGSKALF